MGPRAIKLGQTIGLYAGQEEDAYQEMDKSVRAVIPDMVVLDLVPDELRGIFLANANLGLSERAAVDALSRNLGFSALPLITTVMIAPIVS